MGWKMYVFRSQALLGYVSQLRMHANCFAYNVYYNNDF